MFRKKVNEGEKEKGDDEERSVKIRIVRNDIECLKNPRFDVCDVDVVGSAVRG